MKKIISDIHNAVQNSRKTREFLKEKSTRIWFEDFPIALLHEVTRVENDESLQTLKELNFFDDEGFSKNGYTQEEIDNLKKNVPNAIKITYLLCLKGKHKKCFTFMPKFEHDKWKKIQDEENFEAFVESSKFSDDDCSKTIETEIRDIMRSAKEIPALKAIGFVWIVTLPKTSEIENILNHYFLDNHIYVQKGRKVTYIAWADRLADVNMRHFVNTP